MDREFSIGNKHYIVKEQNDKVRIFLADEKQNPYLELTLIPFDDLNKKIYLSYDIDSIFISTVTSFNNSYPVESIAYSEKIIVTKDHNLYLLAKNNNRFVVYLLETKVIKSLSNNYHILLNKLLQGESIGIGNYILSKETFYNILSNSKIIDGIDEEAKNTVINLVESYKQIFGYPERNVTEGGSSSENAKVKVRKAGFANKLFMICLSCFSFGIIITLIIVLLNKYVF